MEGLGSLLLFALTFYFMMRFGCGAHMIHGHGGHSDRGDASAQPGDRKDPVCGMDVAAGQGYSKMHEGRQLQFCSKQCLDKFELSPERYGAHAGATR